MKAITIWQPWASLLACGAKKYETRSWSTPYRGEIAIHAGAKNIKQVYKEIFPLSTWKYHSDIKAKIYFENAVNKHINTEILDYGCIVATAELVGCWKISDGRSVGIDHPIIEQSNQWKEIWGDEFLFGDWTEGRYAWEFKNMKILDKPVQAKGAQRLWNWENTNEIHSLMKGII